MESNLTHPRLLAVVTLYNPEVRHLAQNIQSYLHAVDRLLVCDNSPLEKHVREELLPLVSCPEKIVWHGDGTNRCIAPAINRAWRMMQAEGLDLLLIMDQDSQWTDFRAYRTAAEQVFAERPEAGAVAPYVPGTDTWDITAEVQPVRFIINSGTVLSLGALNAIGGADEDFPLDGLDMDLSIRLQKAGLRLLCLTRHALTHHLGQPRRCKWLPLGTNDYGTARTYSITRSHVLYLRRHFGWLTWRERWKVVKEAVIYKPVTILLMEEEKRARMYSYLKGLIHGITD